MNILITGGLGFIGSNLVMHLSGEGHNITVLDNLDPHMGGNLSNLDVKALGVELCVQDLMDFGPLSQIVRGKDLIINCAASTSHPSSMREPWLDIDVNVCGTLNILEAMRRFNPDVRFIHIGTSTQLGALKSQPADELHPEFPLDIYSANKSVSEKYVLIYARSYGIRASVVRLANVYGPKAAVHSAEFTFNNFFIGLALQGKDITIFGDGSQKRNIMYVQDAVDAILAVAKEDKTVGETYFAVSDGHISVLEFGNLVVDLFSKGQCVTIPWPPERKETEVGDAILSGEKIRRDTGWIPKVSFVEGLKLTQNFYETQLRDYIK